MYKNAMMLIAKTLFTYAFMYFKQIDSTNSIM